LKVIGQYFSEDLVLAKGIGTNAARNVEIPDEQEGDNRCLIIFEAPRQHWTV
jgi:hypothetical protein